MNREDWTCVGLRLYGAYLLVQALLGLPASVRMVIESNGMATKDLLFVSGPSYVLGVTLLFFAPSLARWVGRSDEEPSD